MENYCIHVTTQLKILSLKYNTNMSYYNVMYYKCVAAPLGILGFLLLLGL